MLRTSCALLVLATATGTATPAPPSPDPQTLDVPMDQLSRARELVRQLGSEQFAERERAEEELSKMGRLARAALLEAVNDDPDAEIRTRCQTLLPRANTLEMKARLEVFLADADGKYEHNLPGWNEFSSLVRDEWTFLGHPIWTDKSLDKAARKVFADLISTQANRYVMLAVGSRDTDLGQLVSARRQELYSLKYPRVMVVGGVVRQPTVRRDPTVADIATLLFAESYAPRAGSTRTNSISVLISSSGFTAAAARGDDTARVYKAIAAAWLESRQDVMDMYYAMNIASNLGLSDQGCRLAARLFESKGAISSYRGMAAATLARLGNKTHLPLLEKAMTDTAVVYTVRKAVAGKPVNEWETHEIQVRDVALAVSVILAGQKIDDYGFIDQYRTNGINGVSYSHTRHYLTEDRRQAAFDKWKAWREKNP